MARKQIGNDRPNQTGGSNDVAKNPTRRPAINKLHFLLINYLQKCAEGAFVKGRGLSPRYFQLKSWVKTNMSPIEIDMLYQYSLGCEKEPKDFFVFTKDATAWNHQRNREVALATRQIEPYKEYRIEDFLGL